MCLSGVKNVAISVAMLARRHLPATAAGWTDEKMYPTSFVLLITIIMYLFSETLNHNSTSVNKSCCHLNDSMHSTVGDIRRKFASCLALKS